MFVWMVCLVWVSTAYSQMDLDYFSPHEDNKEINIFMEMENAKDLPMCEGNSICAFLQANNKGLTKLQYCRCEGGYACPDTWDQFDGQSISQAESDQYKYCGRTPEIETCQSGDEVAYSSYTTYHGDKKVKMRDEIHCVCPFGSSYQDAKYDFLSEGHAEIVKVSYYCMPLRECNATEYCKDITEKPGEYIVNPKCLCSNNLACPSVPTSKKYTNQIRAGDFTLTQIKCQPQYKPGFSLREMYLMMKTKREQALKLIQLNHNKLYPGLAKLHQQPAQTINRLQPQEGNNRFNGWR